MEGAKFKEFLEETVDVAHDDKTKRRFKTLGQNYFKEILRDFELLGYKDLEYYFNEGSSALSGDHVLMGNNPARRIGFYMSMSLYFNERKRLMLRLTRNGKSCSKNFHIGINDFTNKKQLFKCLNQIIAENNDLIENQL